MALAAVQDGVVGPPDGAEVVLGDRHDGRGTDPAHDLPHVEAERLHLVEAGLEDAGGDLHAPCETCRRCHDEGELMWIEPRLGGHPGRDLVGGDHPGLEHEHAMLGLFGIRELLEQVLLHARVSAQRARSHREELAHRHSPAGIL
jgi:hypothetical protein